MAENQTSTELQDLIGERIDDLVKLAPDATAVSLVMVALRILAGQYPPDLDDVGRGRIRDNYPSATDELIAERSISQEGVILAVLMGTEMARIAVDYTPLSHTKPEMDCDFQLPDDTMRSLTASLLSTFDKGTAAGVSPFGVATTMILLGVVKAKEQGVTGLKLMRPLLDAISKALDGGAATPTAQEVEELAIEALCEQMGISRTTAKKYVAIAKRTDR